MNVICCTMKNLRYLFVVWDNISGAMVSVLALNVVDHGFKGQTKEHEIYICCFSTQNLGVRTKMGWLEIRNVSEWSNVSTNGLLFQCLAPLRHWNNSPLVDTLLHSDIGRNIAPTNVRVFQCLSGAMCLPMSEWSNVSTNGLVFQCLSGAMCLPMSEWSDVSTNVWVEQCVYQCTVVSVSEWSNVSTNGLLFQCLSGAMCLPMSEWSNVSTNVWVEQCVYQWTVVSVSWH
jgi:hypothetical protein